MISENNRSVKVLSIGESEERIIFVVKCWFELIL
jgi:hypothetical protein